MKSFVLLSALLGLALAAPREIRLEPESSVPTSLDLAKPTGGMMSVSVTSSTPTSAVVSKKTETVATTTSTITVKASSTGSKASSTAANSSSTTAKPSSTAPVTTPTSRADTGIWLYAEKELTGLSVNLKNPVGTWITFDPNLNSVWPDPNMVKLHKNISSAKINDGIACQVWDDNYGRGKSTIIRGEIVDLEKIGWHKKIASMACWVETM